MSVGLSLLCLISVQVVMCMGALRHETGLRLMPFRDGRPVLALPAMRAPVPVPESYATFTPSRADIKEMARRYIDEMLTSEIKLQQDKANLEKFITEMLMWRKRAFPGPADVNPVPSL